MAKSLALVPKTLTVQRLHKDMLRGAAGRDLVLDPTSPTQAQLPEWSQGASPLDYTGASVVLVRSITSVDGSVIVIPDCVIEEQHADQLQITDHPVEKGVGAFISDHAYKLPAQISMTYGWSPSSRSVALTTHSSPTFLRDVYQSLLNLQNSRTLVTINSGKRQYSNMLIQNLTLTTNRDTENALVARMDCREIQLASSKAVLVSLNPQTLLNAEQSQGTASGGLLSLQPAPTFPYPDWTKDLQSQLERSKQYQSPEGQLGSYYSGLTSH